MSSNTLDGACAWQAAVVSGTSSDSHMWNLVFLQCLLEEHGVEVSNLGVCVPDDYLVQQSVLSCPDVIVIGTVNGHGYVDGLRVTRKLRAAPELAGTLIVIGGHLGVSDVGQGERRAELRAAGCDGVFEGDTAVADFRAFMGAGIRGERMLC